MKEKTCFISLRTTLLYKDKKTLIRLIDRVDLMPWSSGTIVVRLQMHDKGHVEKLLQPFLQRLNEF